MIRNEGRQRGFTLLEVTVALAILAICLTVILRIFATVAGATRIASDYYTALQIAESQMALHANASVGLRADDGTVDDYFRWSVSVDDYRLEPDSPLFVQSDSPTDEAPFSPYLVTVSVSWGEQRPRELQLSTIRLGATR